MPAHGAVLSYLPFDGGTIGQSLADTTAIGGGAIGFSSVQTALTGSAGSSPTVTAGDEISQKTVLAAGDGISRNNARKPEFRQ